MEEILRLLTLSFFPLFIGFQHVSSVMQDFIHRMLVF
jgi:hypothetical protein